MKFFLFNNIFVNRNYIINDKDSYKKQIKIFEEFKNNFMKQNKEKKNELKKLFLSGKYDFDSINDIKNEKNEKKEKKELNKDMILLNNNKDDSIELELSNGEKIKTKKTYIEKYPNSILAAYINSENKSPKRNGNIFIDREPQNFKFLIYFIETNKIPSFKNIISEQKFFSELKFWNVPMDIAPHFDLKFNPIYCPYFFVLDKKCQILSKNNQNKGIVLLNKKLTALTPYIEFSIILNNNHNNGKDKKILLALVDENKIEKMDLNHSFENGVHFVFFWDLFGEKVVKNSKNNHNSIFNREFRTVELNKFCRCYKNNYEVKFGLYYNHEKHSVELIRNGIKLNIIIQNIEPGLLPAFEINNDNCKIKLSSKNKYQDKFFL